MNDHEADTIVMWADRAITAEASNAKLLARVEALREALTWYACGGYETGRSGLLRNDYIVPGASRKASDALTADDAWRKLAEDDGTQG